ncbi:hypothetical protein GBA52_024282 [Prunus armeniaca]|nr:hypothetical protein GBA52_024282 [Prunus armeniaca]
MVICILTKFAQLGCNLYPQVFDTLATFELEESTKVLQTKVNAIKLLPDFPYLTYQSKHKHEEEQASPIDTTVRYATKGFHLLELCMVIFTSQGLPNSAATLTPRKWATFELEESTKVLQTKANAIQTLSRPPLSQLSIKT